MVAVVGFIDSMSLRMSLPHLRAEGAWILDVDRGVNRRKGDEPAPGAHWRRPVPRLDLKSTAASQGVQGLPLRHRSPSDDSNLPPFLLFAGVDHLHDHQRASAGAAERTRVRHAVAARHRRRSPQGRAERMARPRSGLARRRSARSRGRAQVQREDQHRARGDAPVEKRRQALARAGAQAYGRVAWRRPSA